MIFSVKGHVEKIINGTKTQTRRKSPAYIVGKTYAVQLGRNKPGIKEGRILILAKWEETVFDNLDRGGATIFWISATDATAEGGYTPEEFENLFSLMYPHWIRRFCYRFKFITRKELSLIRRWYEVGK